MAKLLANGINQSDLVDLINSIKTKWNAVLLKLDNDATLDVDTYVSANALSIPSGIQIAGVKAIRDQGAIVTFLNNAITQFNAVLVKLDADDLGGMDNNYVSTLGLTDVVGNSKVDGITNAGIYQGSVIKVLNDWITNYNLLLVKLDADPLTAGDYVATNAITDTIVEEGSKARPRIAGLIIAFVLSSLIGSIGHAFDRTSYFSGNLVNENIACTKNVDLDLHQYGIDNLSVHMIYSTTTFSAVTFVDGTRETNRFTVTSTHLNGSTIRINGVSLVHGVDFSTAATTTLVAKNIAAAIKAKSTLYNVCTATNGANVVYATATTVGVHNYSTAFSSGGATWLYPIFQGGVASDISLAGDTISKTNTYSVGLPVLLTKTAASTAPAPLAANVTYYVTSPTPTSFKLANASTAALAGTGLNITTMTTNGGGSFTLTPSKSSGSPILKLQKSNDNTNWYDLTISTTPGQTLATVCSVTFATPYTASSRFWDIGKVYWRYLRFSFTKGTWGNVNVKLAISGRKN